MISSFTQLEESILCRAREQIESGITKVARNTFPDQDHSYTVELAGAEVKLFMNLRKSEENAIVGSGKFKVSKCMKRVGSDEVAVRSVLRYAKDGITTEAQVFERIKNGEGAGKEHVLQATVFAFRRKNGDLAVACVAPLCQGKFNDLTKEQKKSSMKAVALGLEYLHANGIVHCDINGKNILIKDNVPVIIDIEGALLFDKKTGILDSEFLKRRVDKHPYFFKDSAPPDIRNATGAAFDALQFDRAKKWDLFALGQLINYAYNLGIVVEGTNNSPKLTKDGYSDNMSEVPNCDYEVYRAPLDVPDHEKNLVSVVLKCLQGQPISWPEILTVL